MLYRVTTILFVLTLAINSFCQVKNIGSNRFQDYIAVEGRGWKVKIDSTTSLDSLIGRLSGKWNFVETGKAYWIGYTEDMYSIAAHDDRAIPLLVDLLQNSSNQYARYGAVFCLHLVGINRIIAGRFHEEFVNPQARSALLQFLKDSTLQKTIMRLLMRDPWPSDIPYIIDALKSSKFDSWALVNGLIRYRIKNFPVHQEIPESLNKIAVKLRRSKKKDDKFDFDAEIREVLISFKRLNNESIVVEDSLLRVKLMGDFSSSFESPLSIKSFFFKFDFTRYVTLGSRVHYYVVGERLFICTSETARKKLIDWWARLSESERQEISTIAS